MMSDERVERRLAAILAADVAGYSRLIGEDEEGTLAMLRAMRRETIDPAITEHRGRIVKTTGDGLLAEFQSVVDALRCAAAWQTAVPAGSALTWRIGVHQGDIVVEDGDIFGDGVNVAARLEALAEPGGICVSARVQEDTLGKLDLSFEDMGEQSLKNIARPVRVYRIAPSRPQRPRGAPFAHRREARLSIVVLPFVNLSGDPEQEYFADAVTDDLTTDLSRIADSFVISRTTAFTYKGKPIDVKQIGRQLGVRYILEGSVRRLGDEVRVNVQLIDTGTAAHIWAERFDTDRTNLAKAQRDITDRLARTLHLELIQAAGRQIEQENPANLDARDLIMRGWSIYYRGLSRPNLQDALRFFEQALELDPESAAARIGIGRVLIEVYGSGWSATPEKDLDRAERCLDEALERGRNEPQLYIGFGRLRRFQGRVSEAKLAFESAIELDRNNSTAILQLGVTLIVLANPAEALPLFEQALRLNPRNENVHFFYHGLGEAHLYLGQLDAAVGWFQKARAANKQFYRIPFYLAAALGLRGDIADAQAALAEALKLRPEIRSLADWRRHSTYSPPFRELAENTLDLGLRRAGLPEQ